MTCYSIAIDGPAGAGKSTIAKKLSKKLGFVYIDTGAMYRTMGLYCLRHGIGSDDEDILMETLGKIDVDIKFIDGEQHFMLDGEDVSGLIRTTEVGDMASAVSVHKRVRAHMVDLQRKLAGRCSVIMDGRDIGSVVLPNADLKIYLSASVDVRAKRRYDELTAKGQQCDIHEIEKEIAERDYRDMHRENSPLIKVEDAVEVDTSYMTIDEVTDTIFNLFEKVKKA